MTAEILHAGEDWLLFAEPNLDRRLKLAKMLRKMPEWEEVVPGIADITVKFDPNLLTAEDAEALLQLKLTQPGQLPSLITEKPVRLTACTDGSLAPDAAMVSDLLGLGQLKLGDWLNKRSYRVTMMGFQPGFVYLEDQSDEQLPTIPRLQNPRQTVAAGSIGCLGRQLCIYSLDGPGGWPIIGRIKNRLFDVHDWEKPFLLHAGQEVRFNNLPAQLFGNLHV